MSKRTTAIIIAIGDELLIGQTLDTNSYFLSKELTAIGVDVVKRITIADEEVDMLESIQTAIAKYDIVLTTGGLGPTKDDKTKKVLANLFGVELTYRANVYEHLKQQFAHKGEDWLARNKHQAYLPSNATAINNRLGTAPAIGILGKGVFLAMPGVPSEMKIICKEQLLPLLKKQFDLPIIVHRYIHTVGIGESQLAEIIADIETNKPERIGLAYLPRLGCVTLRLTYVAATQGKEELSTIDEIQKTIAQRLKKYVYGTAPNESLELAVGQLLINQSATVALAESCTGGLICNALISNSGSSQYVKGGVVAYDNEMKMSLLGVAKESIETNGAVSEAVVAEMAVGAVKSFGSNYGIAVSGIAGPSGGTAAKPVGTVCIAISDGEHTLTKQVLLKGDRIQVMQRTSNAALNFLRLYITNQVS